MTAGFTELLTKQVALTGTETDLGALFGESTGKIRLSIPDAAASSVWLGKKGVTTADDEYKKGTQTQLPTTSLRGWYAITNGASVTVTIAMATGGVDAPDWITAGTNGASTGGGGGGSAVDQGAGDAASPWFVQGVNGGVPERLATDRATFANPSAARIANADATAFVTPLTDDELRSAPVPTSNATASQLDGHSETIGATTDTDTGSTVVALLKRLKALLAGGLPAALGGSGGLKSEGVGVAGTPAGGVASVQGVAGGTALTVAGSVTTSAPANTTATGNLTALNDAVSIVAGTGNAIGIQLTGTWSGTVAFEASFDGGSTWVAVSVLPVGATTMVSSTTANGNWSVQAGGLTNFRTRRSVATSGTAAAALVLTNGQRSMAGFPVVTQNPAATNWTISTNEIPTFAAMLMVNNQSGGANMVKGDTLGVPCFQGRNPESNTSYGNPVAVGYKNGSGQSRVPLCDASDRTVVSGGAAAGASVSGLNPIYAGGSDGTNARGFTMKAANPLAADYGTTIREIPLQKSSTKTTAGTPAASLVVRAGPCWLFDVFVSNQSANAGYLTVYDLTSAPTHGAAATARKIPGRHIDTKVSSDPFNFKEDFGGLYFATGCVLVIENAEDDANTNTTGAQTMTMNATFVAGT